MLTHNMNETQNGAREKWCSNAPNCMVMIKPKEDCFVDYSTNKPYCTACGQRLRYHRKKAMERGEVMPISFSDISSIK